MVRSASNPVMCPTPANEAIQWLAQQFVSTAVMLRCVTKQSTTHLDPSWSALCEARTREYQNNAVLKSSHPCHSRNVDGRDPLANSFSRDVDVDFFETPLQKRVEIARNRQAKRGL